MFYYASGEPILVGDNVIFQKMKGVVVGIVDKGQYFDGSIKQPWDSDGQGVLVETAEMGLIFCQDAEYIADLIKLN